MFFLQVKKVVCLLLAPDIDNIESKGGLNDVVGDLLKMAADTGEFGDKKPVPVFFVMNRWTLKKATLRKVPISCVAVLNYHGSDQNFKDMNEMLPELKNAYQEKLNEAIEKISKNLMSTSTFCNDEQIRTSEENNCDNKNCDTLATGLTNVQAKTDMINERMLAVLRQSTTRNN